MSTSRRTLLEDLDPEVEAAIRKATLRAAGIGVHGLLAPGVDEAATAAVWTAMVATIARRQGATLSAATVAKLVATALAAAASYKMGSRVLTWLALPLIVAFPVAGWPAATVLNAIINACFTYRLGLQCARRFNEPGLTARDALDVARHLAGLPSAEEWAGLRALLRP